MKKTISILLVIVMMLSIFSITVSAATHDQFPEVENKYYDKFVEKIDCSYEPWEYKEIYNYYTTESSEEPAWVLIYAQLEDDMWLKSHGVVAGNRIIFTSSFDVYSHSRIYVYVTAFDELLYVDHTQIDEVIEKCPGFLDALEKQNIGQLIGDVNDDSKLDIVDVTLIQRNLAGYVDEITSRYGYDSAHKDSERFSWKDEICISYEDNHGFNCKYDYISDFDRDGERTVMDATAIQRHVAGIEVRSM